jgi:hypothetical protein
LRWWVLLGLSSVDLLLTINKPEKVIMPKKSIKKSKRRPGRTANTWKIVLPAFSILLLVLAGASVLGQRETSLAERITGGQSVNDGEAGEQEAASKLVEVSDALFSNTRHIMGDPSAPVTLIEFSDFQ